jgi:phosphoribosylformylglycinamidine cyclo-ligase
VFARIAYGLKDGSLPGTRAEGGITPGLRGAAAQEAGAELLRNDRALRKLMFNTYNMGIGLVLALAPEDAAGAIAFLGDRGFPAWEIGRVELPQGPAGELRFE